MIIVFPFLNCLFQGMTMVSPLHLLMFGCRKVDLMPDGLVR